jgi:membrane protease YdiL (CAAX protease family)
MSTKIRIWSKEAAVPSVIALFSISIFAQIPHIYFLSEVVELNKEGFLPLLIAFPIFAALVLSAVALLISEHLLGKVRSEKDRKVFRYLLRGALISIALYYVIQFFIVFFLFQVIEPIRDAMPNLVVDAVTLKEIVGMVLLLIAAFFINPPVDFQKGKKK